MKKVNIEEARQINGGRWKCKICGRKFLLLADVLWHLAGGEAWKGYSVSGNYSWCL